VSPDVVIFKSKHFSQDVNLENLDLHQRQTDRSQNATNKNTVVHQTSNSMSFT